MLISIRLSKDLEHLPLNIKIYNTDTSAGSSLLRSILDILMYSDSVSKRKNINGCISVISTFQRSELLWHLVARLRGDTNL